MESQFLPLFTKLKRDDENGHHSTLFDSVCMVLRTGFPKIGLKDVEKHVDDDRVHCALLLAPGSLEPLKACVQSREVFQLDGSLAGYEALRQSILLDAASDSEEDAEESDDDSDDSSVDDDSLHGSSDGEGGDHVLAVATYRFVEIGSPSLTSFFESLLLAETSREAPGFGFERVMQVFTCAVRPAVQRRGYGRRLMSLLIQKARSEHASSVLLHCDPGTSLFRPFGFSSDSALLSKYKDIKSFMIGGDPQVLALLPSPSSSVDHSSDVDLLLAKCGRSSGDAHTAWILHALRNEVVALRSSQLELLQERDSLRMQVKLLMEQRGVDTSRSSSDARVGSIHRRDPVFVEVAATLNAMFLGTPFEDAIFLHELYELPCLDSPGAAAEVTAVPFRFAVVDWDWSIRTGAVLPELPATTTYSDEIELAADTDFARVGVIIVRTRADGSSMRWLAKLTNTQE